MQLSIYYQMNPTLDHFFGKIKKKVSIEQSKQKKQEDKKKDIHKPIYDNKCETKSKNNNEKDKIINQKSLLSYFKPNQNPIKLQQKQNEDSPEKKESFRDEVRDNDLESKQYEYLYSKFENNLRKEECKSAPHFKRRNRKENPLQRSILSYIHKRKIKQEQEHQQLDPVDIDWKKINTELSQQHLLHLIPTIDIDKKKVQKMKKQVEKPRKETKINQIKKEDNFQISVPVQLQNSRIRKTRNKNLVNYREKSSSESVQRNSEEKKQITRKSPQKIPVIQHKLHLIKFNKEALRENRRVMSEFIQRFEKICIQYPKKGDSIHIDYQTMKKHHKQTLKLLFQSYI